MIIRKSPREIERIAAAGALVAETIAHETGHELKASLGPPRAGDIRRSLGSPARASAALKVKAETGLAEGLRQTLAWMRKG